MKPVPGYVYFISEEYFRDVKDPKLMRNKGEHNKRPCYCCKETEMGIYWMVPLSSKIDKFRNNFAESESKYGRCITIVLGRFAGKDAAFLIQNAFPVKENYIADIYKKNGNPIPVHTKLQQLIYGKLQGSMAIHRKGYNTFYTDIDRDELIMLQKQAEKKLPLTEMISAAESKRDKNSARTPIRGTNLDIAL